MTKLRLVLILFLTILASEAFAQCSGQFQAGQICGNPTGSQALPAASDPSGFSIPSSLTVGTSPIAGGTNNCIAYDVSGVVQCSTTLPNGTSTTTQASSDSSTKLATTAFVQALIGAFCSLVPNTCTVLYGYANVTWWGVVADASTSFNSANATANSAGIVSALATNQCVLFPPNANGYSLPSNTLVIATNQCIRNPTQVLLKAVPGSNGWVFHITAQQQLSSWAYLVNAHVDTTGASSGSTVFRFATTAANVYGVWIEHIICTNVYQCIGDETSASQYVFDITLYDIRMLETLGGQIKISRSRGFINLNSIRIDQTTGNGQVVVPTWNDAEFDDFIGLEMVRFTSLGPVGTGTYTAGHTSLVLSGVAGASTVYMYETLIESHNGNCFTASTLQLLTSINLTCFEVLGNSLQLSSISDSQFSNTVLVGASGISGAAAGVNAFSCSSCNRVAVSNLNIQLFTGSAYVLGGTSSSNTLSNFNASSNTGFAILFSSTGISNTVINGGSIASNGGTFSNSATGSGNVIQNIAGYNPVGLTAGTSTGTSASTITAGYSPETHYITQSANFNAVIKSGSTTLCTVPSATVPCVIDLGPNESYSVTWTTTQPTYSKFVH